MNRVFRLLMVVVFALVIARVLFYFGAKVYYRADFILADLVLVLVAVLAGTMLRSVIKALMKKTPTTVDPAP